MPLIVVSPQCAVASRWEPALLIALLKHLQAKFSIDPNRIYVTGYSMGGYGTRDLITAAPSEFAAAFPIASGGDPAAAPRLLEIPIWAFHGARDKVVPLEATQIMVQTIQAAGGKNARLTILENEGHGICDSIFARADLYAWLAYTGSEKLSQALLGCVGTDGDLMV